MSYILEALKKAEAEREQGKVPGLRSQEWSPNAPMAPVKAWHAGRWWALGLLLIGLAGIGLWFWRSEAAAERLVANTPEERGSVAGPKMPSMAASQGLVLPLPEVVAPATPEPAPIPVAPATVAAPLPAKPKAAKASAPAASASERVLKWADMTAAERQKLPKLNWGGAMHSTDPAARMVIINDQVMREGDALGPGLVLERIEPKSLVLNLDGRRIRKEF